MLELEKMQLLVAEGTYRGKRWPIRLARLLFSPFPRYMMPQAPLSDSEQPTAPWLNCTVVGATAFSKQQGYKWLQANLATLVSKLRIELGEVWARHGPSACIVVDAGNMFGALRTNRCMGGRKIFLCSF